MSAHDFASRLLGELRQRDPRARALQTRPGRKSTVEIGIDDEGFVPLLRLSGGSAKFNVMSLLVRHRNTWAPTFQRGTPAALAEQLAGPLHYLWTLPLLVAEPGPSPEESTTS